MKRAVFLDRDGVLNDAIVKNGKPYPPSSLQELCIAKDVLPALRALKKQGFLLLGATNQPDVARGKTERRLVEAINAELMQQLPLDEIRVCYHDDNDQCDCRKPAPGLLLQAASAHDVDLPQSFMIGDRWKDITAGKKAGCRAIWINRQYDECQPNDADAMVASLEEAAAWILKCSPDECFSHPGESRVD
jgi:D-glycero-D-manno-heptose 1,7-bisphosphate phosphatase